MCSVQVAHRPMDNYIMPAPGYVFVRHEVAVLNVYQKPFHIEGTNLIYF